MNKLKANFNNLPYNDSYTYIDKENTILQIGNSDYYEDIFRNTGEDLYIETICEMIPHYSFDTNIQVSMNYNNDNINQIVRYNLYDRSIISMENVVSSIDIILLDILNKNNINTNLNDDNFKTNINNHSINSSENNNIIYTKFFGKQNKNICLETIEYETEYGINTISKAYMFGGSFKPNDIQQYLFYIKHNYNERPYISLISSEDIINNKKDIQLASSINRENLSTLQDDIMNGKIVINLSNKKYKSIFYKKSTLISNKFNIIFKSI